MTIAGWMLAAWTLVLTTMAQGSPAAPDARATDGYFTGADGVRLFYRQVGSGRSTAVFLHGGPGLSMHDGDCYVEPLARGRTIILYDQRGGGRSQLISDSAQLTAAHHVRDLEALRKHFGLEQMDIIALSWGAGLAALYAAEHPTRVRRIVLAAPMPIAQVPYAATRRAAIDEALGHQRARLNEISQQMPKAGDDEAVALCREAFDIGARPYLTRPELWATETCQRCDVPPAAIRNRAVIARATLGSLGEWDFRPALRTLSMPILVLEGTRTVVPLDSTREWAQVTRNGRLLLFENAGHLFTVEKPELFRAAVDEFLRGRFPKGAAQVGAPKRK